MRYEAVIGLEVHAELSTRTKIYCGCRNSFGSMVNANCCPVCTGMPGALPTLNESVVDYAVRMGFAAHCTINRIFKMDRKNYFYPDLPKAYQISQFDIPLCEHGYIDVIVDGEGHTRRIGVTRIHIEEDAGKLIHPDGFDGSLVDFNRSGVPLIEIVSEPDIRSAHEAKAYLDTIRSTLRYLDISDCKMQEGSIRCDVNVSVRPQGCRSLGTRVEMKNVNSFGGTVRAIEYETARQTKILEEGGTVSRETRRWDDAAGRNILMRTKEEAQDYRFFPEPDLGTVVVDEERLRELRASIPELPNEKLLRLMREYGLPYADANLLAENPEKADFMEQAASLGRCRAKSVANWLLGDVTRILNDGNLTLADTRLSPEKLADLISLTEKGEISVTAGKTVLDSVILSGRTPEQVIEEKGLKQVSDSVLLDAMVGRVLEENGKVADDYRKGKTNALGYLIGQCMRASKGRGNPGTIRELLLKKIQKPDGGRNVPSSSGGQS